MSPHVHSGDSVQNNMLNVIIALVPAALFSLYAFGVGAAVVMLTSVAACVFFEWAITRFILKAEPTACDLSAALTGLLLGFNLPSNLPIWIIIIGALVGRVFLLISFPVQMTTWPEAGQLGAYTDATTGATPLSVMTTAIKSGDASVLSQLPSSMDMLLGTYSQGGAGCLGEISALALLIGFAWMLFKKTITWHIPVSIIGTVLVFAGLLHVANPVYADPFQVLFSGGLMLGAIFMATDYVSSPMNSKGQVIYGVAIGFLTVVIRNFGAYPEGMSFAILIMNAFTPLINNYCKPKRFGEVVKK